MTSKFIVPSWNVLHYDINSNKIEVYDVLAHMKSFVREAKKSSKNKEEFSQRVRSRLMYHYWSKCEWELVVEIDGNEHIWVSPWVGCKDPQSVAVDVTDATDFDWTSFAKKHISEQRHETKAKIDVFDQVEWRWEEFVDYCWHTRQKYERDDPKFYS